MPFKASAVNSQPSMAQPHRYGSPGPAIPGRAFAGAADAIQGIG
jgi:hypothetical protein